MNGALGRYLKHVAANMNLNKAQKKCLFTEIRAELEDRLEEQPHRDYADVVKALGQPEEFAGALSAMDLFVPSPVALRNTSNRLRCALIITTALVIALVVFCVWLALTQPGYYMVE